MVHPTILALAVSLLMAPSAAPSADSGADYDAGAPPWSACHTEGIHIESSQADAAPSGLDPSTNAACIRFTLANRGLKKIPLRIPGVMNPNLSPMSNSGVCLEAGQKVYFRKAGRDVLILEVYEGLSDTVLVVNKLLPKTNRD